MKTVYIATTKEDKEKLLVIGLHGPDKFVRKVEVVEVPDKEHLNSLLLDYFNAHAAVRDPVYHFSKGYREYEALITPLVAQQQAEIEQLKTELAQIRKDITDATKLNTATKL
jgi:hypothetical protein